MQELVARQREALGETNPETLLAKMLLGELYIKTGQFPAARKDFEELLPAARGVWGEKHRNTARILCDLGVACGALGDYAAGRRLLESSLAIRKEVLGENDPETARGLHLLAYALEDTGDYEGALVKYKEALAIRQAVLEPQDLSTLVTINNIAVLLKTTHQYAKAVEYYEKTIERLRRAYGEENVWTAAALVNAGAFLHAIGQFDRARDYLERGVDILRKPTAESQPWLASALHNLGALLSDMGEFEQALPHFDEALALTRRARSEGSVEEVAILHALAWMHVRREQHEQALSLLQQVTRIQDQILGHSFAAGSERQRKASALFPVMVLHEVLTLVGKHFADRPEAVRTAFDLLLRRKGITAEALAIQRDGVLGGRYPELRSEIKTLSARRAEIARLLLDGPGFEDPASHQQRITWLQEDRERLEAELAQVIPELKMEESFRTADAAALAAEIPAGHVLVEFLRLNVCSFEASANQVDRKLRRYLAFVLPAGQPERLQMLDLGDAARIDSLVTRVRSAVGSSQPSRHFVLDEDMAPAPGDEAGAELRKAVFDRIGDAVGDCRRLLLAPDGDLLFLPFEILPAGDGRRLIDTWHFSYLTAARDLLRLGRRACRRAGPAFIAVDPNYNLAAREAGDDSVAADAHSRRIQRDLDRRYGRFEPLPKALIEGQRIAHLLDVTPSFGNAVTKGQIVACRSPRILHLATHGFFLESSNSSDTNAATISTDRLALLSQQMENPLLRSGMALAGANTWLKFQPLPLAAGNGILTAEDVTGLDLLDTELVVLSACETGLGTEDFCEGVMGLRRSFGLAGARTVIMSLWKIPDDQTADLMVDFYRRTLGGAAKAEALRDAQLAIKAKHPDPYFWGAFICQGDAGPL